MPTPSKRRYREKLILREVATQYSLTAVERATLQREMSVAEPPTIGRKAAKARALEILQRRRAATGPSLAMQRVDAAAIALRVQPLSEVPAAQVEAWKTQMSEILQTVQHEQAGEVAAQELDGQYAGVIDGVAEFDDRDDTADDLAGGPPTPRQHVMSD